MNDTTNQHPTVRPGSDVHLARVTSVEGVGTSGKISVRLMSFDAFDDQDATIEARLCVPYAGQGHGAFFVPNVDDEVLICFVGGDPRGAIVMGGIWNGQNGPDEALGGSGKKVDRWSLVGANGTRIAIVEESAGEAKIELSTPGGVSAVFTQSSGGSIEFSAGGTTVTIDSNGLTVDTSGSFSVTATDAKVTSPTISFDAAETSMSGKASCIVLDSSTVISGTYTPGAGNIL